MERMAGDHVSKHLHGDLSVISEPQGLWGLLAGGLLEVRQTTAIKYLQIFNMVCFCIFRKGVGLVTYTTCLTVFRFHSRAAELHFK